MTNKTLTERLFGLPLLPFVAVWLLLFFALSVAWHYVLVLVGVL